MELKTNECVGKCDWKPAESDGGEVEREGQPIFECGGCGSEWAPTEEWTPKNADGTIAPAVARARMVADAKPAGGEAAAPALGAEQAEGAEQPQNDSADTQAAPTSPAPAMELPPVIEAQADGTAAPTNDSADTQAAPVAEKPSPKAGGNSAGSW